MVSVHMYSIDLWKRLNDTLGGTLVSQGAISIGDLTSLLLYTVYVGSGLQMLTCVFF